jgi:hypothetical protein
MPDGFEVAPLRHNGRFVERFDCRYDARKIGKAHAEIAVPAGCNRAPALIRASGQRRKPNRHPRPVTYRGSPTCLPNPGDLKATPKFGSTCPKPCAAVRPWAELYITQNLSQTIAELSRQKV